MYTIGELIKKYRQEKNISYEYLSHTTGIDLITLIKIENNQVAPYLEELKLIAKALDIPLNYLMSANCTMPAYSRDIARIMHLVDALHTQERIYYYTQKTKE